MRVKKLLSVLQRSLMFALTFMPIVALAGRGMTGNFAIAPVWLGAQSLLAALLALLPAYVGNYTRTEVLRHEGRGDGDVPDLNRETRRETVVTGHRVPIRLPACLICLVAMVTLCLIAPMELFKRRVMLQLAFTAMMTALEFICMYSVSSSACVWTELPGVMLGYFFYVILAFYLQFSKADNDSLNTLVGACALAYVFFSGLCLNRHALGNSGSEDSRSVPAGLLRRNRRIVIGVTVTTGLISFVKPIRSGAVWVLNRILDALKWVAWLLRGKQEVQGGNIEKIEEMAGGYMNAPVSDELPEPVNDTFEKVLTIAFLIFVGLGLCWMIFDGLKRLAKKLSELMEKFAGGINEGYYDEKTDIDPEEAKEKVHRTLGERIRQLFARETPWEKLTGREKARRLVKELYKKRGLRVNGLRSLTAREALPQMAIKTETALRTASEYEKARYSSAELDGETLDGLRKEIRP